MQQTGNKQHTEIDVCSDIPLQLPKPAIQKYQLRKLLGEDIWRLLPITTGISIIGIRGYFRYLTKDRIETSNKRVYSDAIIVCTPRRYTTFNGYTGSARDGEKSRYILPGISWFKIGLHGEEGPVSRQYKALLQADFIKAKQVGVLGVRTGFFGIEFKKGDDKDDPGNGNQTIFPDQWSQFIGLVESESKHYNHREFPYYLKEI